MEITLYLEKAVTEYKAGNYAQWECAWGPRMGLSRSFLKTQDFKGDTSSLSANQLHSWNMGSVDYPDAVKLLASLNRQPAPAGRQTSTTK